ncbi:hypothetical protein H4582DRAFT_2058046 [Lactarius indigo]|nr:hypothetical protein H4582DRAFT_2058046 [Lactarius indigo]
MYDIGRGGGGSKLAVGTLVLESELCGLRSKVLGSGVREHVESVLEVHVVLFEGAQFQAQGVDIPPPTVSFEVSDSWTALVEMGSELDTGGPCGRTWNRGIMLGSWGRGLFAQSQSIWEEDGMETDHLPSTSYLTPQGNGALGTPGYSRTASVVETPCIAAKGMNYVSNESPSSNVIMSSLDFHAVEQVDGASTLLFFTEVQLGPLWDAWVVLGFSTGVKCVHCPAQQQLGTYLIDEEGLVSSH